MRLGFEPCDNPVTRMALGQKVKTALDETRTLILGAQILLGFQYHGAFQERFEALSSEARTVSAYALGLDAGDGGIAYRALCLSPDRGARGKHRRVSIP